MDTLGGLCTCKQDHASPYFLSSYKMKLRKTELELKIEKNDLFKFTIREKLFHPTPPSSIAISPNPARVKSRPNLSHRKSRSAPPHVRILVEFCSRPDEDHKQQENFPCVSRVRASFPSLFRSHLSSARARKGPSQAGSGAAKGIFTGEN